MAEVYVSFLYFVVGILLIPLASLQPAPGGTQVELNMLQPGMSQGMMQMQPHLHQSLGMQMRMLPPGMQGMQSGGLQMQQPGSGQPAWMSDARARAVQMNFAMGPEMGGGMTGAGGANNIAAAGASPGVPGTVDGMGGGVGAGMGAGMGSGMGTAMGGAMGGAIGAAGLPGMALQQQAQQQAAQQQVQQQAQQQAQQQVMAAHGLTGQAGANQGAQAIPGGIGGVPQPDMQMQNSMWAVGSYPQPSMMGGQFGAFQYPIGANYPGGVPGMAGDPQLAISMITTPRPAAADVIAKAGIEGTVTLTPAVTKPPASTPYPKVLYVDNPKFTNGMINWKDVADALVQIGKVLNWLMKFSYAQ